MPQNPYVRTIRLFNPAADLAIDDADPRRVRKRRPPVNPAEGLLDDDADLDAPPTSSAASSVSRSAAPDVERTRMDVSDSGRNPPVAESATPSPSAPASTQNGDESASEKFQSSVLGEVPDIIEGDFPEPVDL